MNKIELSHLRSMLPRGSRDRIQKATGYSHSYIDQVLSGKRYNQVILDVALEILLEEQKAKQLATTKFWQIINVMQ